MAKIRDFRELGDFLRGLKSPLRRAAARALSKTAVAASNQAKRNTKTQFTGRPGKPKQGFLAAAIFPGFEPAGEGNNRRIADAFVGVKSQKGNLGTRPYGRIHEYGGPIIPRKAKKLWIPLSARKNLGGLYDLSNMTPSEFMEEKKRKGGPLDFFILRSKNGGYVAGARWVQARKTKVAREVKPFGGSSPKFKTGTKLSVKSVLLFALKDRVQMPARPYVRPAVEQEWKSYKDRLEFELAQLKGK